MGRRSSTRGPRHGYTFPYRNMSTGCPGNPVLGWPAAMAPIAGARSAAGLSVAILLVVLGASACASRTPPQVTPLSPSHPAEFAGTAPPKEAVALIAELKAFEGMVGVTATGNFLEYSTHPTADDRCYFTGKLQLPEFYSGLRMIREDQAH